MGLTLTTLHIPGDAAAILPLLMKGETLRTHCPGWMTILPGPDTPDRGEQSLQKLAKRIPGACLYFHYFDDDMFQLLLFEGGKRTAALSTCDMMGKSSKVDRISAAIFGDDRATAALKLISKCTDVEEQLALAEEALGVSLLEDAEFPPRQVTPGTAVYDAVIARMASLKKRKNAYRAVLIAPEAAPAELLRHSPSLPYRAPVMREVALPTGDSVQVDWRHNLPCAPAGEYVGPAFGKHGPDTVVRMTAAGAVLWAFRPEGAPVLNASPQGRPGTLLVCGYGTQKNAPVWELSIDNGSVLHKWHLRHGCFGQLRWLEMMQCVASFWRTQEQCGFTLLDGDLRETEERIIPRRVVPFDQPMAVEGCVWWAQDPFTQQVVAYDVATGALTEIVLEDRAYFTGLGSNGLLTATKTGKDLLLFDRTGRLVSKHPFKGVASIRNVPVIGGAMYIVEEMGDINPFAVEEPEKKLWRLEKL